MFHLHVSATTHEPQVASYAFRCPGLLKSIGSGTSFVARPFLFFRPSGSSVILPGCLPHKATEYSHIASQRRSGPTPCVDAYS